MVTIPKSVTPMCQISLMQFTASTLSGWARRLLEVHYPLRWMSWPNLFQILLFYASSAKLLDRPLRQRMRKKDRTKDRLMGRFYLSSRPPNGLPPRSCVIYVKRALALFQPQAA